MVKNIQRIRKNMTMRSLVGVNIIWVYPKYDIIIFQILQIHVDNQVAIPISNDPIFHGKTKHFKIKLYHLREEQKDGVIKLFYCKTEDQIADVLNKALPKARFETLRDKLGLCSY